MRRNDYDCVTCLHPLVIVHDCKLRVDGISKYLGKYVRAVVWKRERERKRERDYVRIRSCRDCVCDWETNTKKKFVCVCVCVCVCMYVCRCVCACDSLFLFLTTHHTHYTLYTDNTAFQFDHTFHEENTTEEVYLCAVQPLVDFVIMGGRATVFACTYICAYVRACDIYINFYNVNWNHFLNLRFFLLLSCFLHHNATAHNIT